MSNLFPPISLLQLRLWFSEHPRIKWITLDEARQVLPPEAYAVLETKCQAFDNDVAFIDAEEKRIDTTVAVVDFYHTLRELFYRAGGAAFAWYPPEQAQRAASFEDFAKRVRAAMPCHLRAHIDRRQRLWLYPGLKDHYTRKDHWIREACKAELDRQERAWAAMGGQAIEARLAQLKQEADEAAYHTAFAAMRHRVVVPRATEDQLKPIHCLPSGHLGRLSPANPDGDWDCSRATIADAC